MAQVVLYAKTGIANWDDANKWNTAADGSGTDYTNPANGGGTTYLCDLNAKNVALNVGGSVSPTITVDQIRTGATNAGGTIGVGNSGAPILNLGNGGITPSYAGAMVTWGTGTCSLTVNGNATYSSTYTSGAFPTGASQSLFINGLLTNTSSGYAILESSTGIVGVVNAGVTAVSNSSSGRAIDMEGSGALTLTGNVANSGSGTAVRVNSSSANHAFTGNVSITSSGIGFQVNAGTVSWTPGSGTSLTNAATSSSVYAMAVTGGALFINGSPTTVNNSNGAWTSALYVNGGTLQWSGARTIAAGAELEIDCASGAIQFANATAALTLTNSGTFVLRKSTGTLTYTAAGGTASIIRATETSYCAMPGCTDAEKAIITGPTLPTAGNVLTGSGTFGYAGSVQTPTLTLPDVGYVLTSAWGGPATYGAGGTGSTPTATLTDAANVWHTASAFGASGNSITPSKVGSSITNLAAGNLASGITVDDVGPGTFTHTADYTLISGVVVGADVRYGTARYSGGSSGTAYIPSAADVRFGTNVDATTGTAYIPAASNVRFGTNVDATTGTCHVPTAAQTESGVSVDVSGTGTFTHTSDYVAKTDVVSASYVVTGHDNYVGGTGGTYPTTATSQAAQYAADHAVVSEASDNIDGGVSILEVEGTGVTATDIQNAIAAALAEGVMVADYATGKAPLQPTTAGRTLDVDTDHKAPATGNWNTVTPPSKVEISAQVWSDKPTIGTSTLTTADIDNRLAAWGKTGFALSATTGWGGAVLPTSFSASNLPADYLSAGEQSSLSAAGAGTWYVAPTIPTASQNAAAVFATTTASMDALASGTFGKWIRTVLGGITSLASWLRGICWGDGTSRTEINDGGGSWDERTDSLAGISNQIGTPVASPESYRRLPDSIDDPVRRL